MNKRSIIKNFILSLLYPDRCVICDEVVDIRGGGICAECMSKIRVIDDNRCFKCGKQLKDPGLEYCQDCEKITHKFDRGYALYTYDENIKKSIYRFKYSNRRRYSIFYGNEIAKNLGKEILDFKPDALIPVPIHPNRMKRRGYNQAQLLADEIGRNLGIPVLDDIIVRVKDTEPLKLQGVMERQNNLKKAFKINQIDVKLNSIVIVDDIYTTGSTMDEISGILREAGIKNIGCITLASGSNI